MSVSEFIISGNNEVSQLKANSTFYIMAPEKGNQPLITIIKLLKAGSGRSSPVVYTGILEGGNVRCLEEGLKRRVGSNRQVSSEHQDSQHGESDRTQHQGNLGKSN